MIFNPTLCKQIQQFLLSQKMNSNSYPLLHFKDDPLHQIQLQKYLGVFYIFIFKVT